jgi:membrane protein
MAQDAPLIELMRIVGRRFIEDRCGQTASALTFTTLLAVVPTVTIALALVSAFPVFESFTEQLRGFVMENLLPQSADLITSYAEKFSANASRLTAVGLGFIGVTALLLMLTIDAAFNRIWRVSRPRPLVQRIVVYWTVLTIGPLCVGASLSLTSYLLTLSLNLVDEVPGMSIALLRFVPLLLTSTAFALLYFMMPNRPVLKRDALIGGIAAGAGFEVMKQGFGIYVTHFPAYTMVYGAFAAVPIFLLWIYLSWLIVIGGAVLVAVLPEWREHAGQSEPVPGSDLFDALQILKILRGAHQTGEIVTLSQLHPVVKVRLDHLEGILNALVGATWVARCGTDGWVLSRDITAIKLKDVYRLFVFHSDAHVPARHADPELETLVYGISSRITDHMQMSLGELFSQVEENHIDDAAAATSRGGIKAV